MLGLGGWMSEWIDGWVGIVVCWGSSEGCIF